MTTPNYNNLRGGSRARLAKMRASKHAWRDARRYGIGDIEINMHGPTFSKDERGRWNRFSCILTSVMDGLRDLGPVDELHKRDNSEIGWRLFDHKGWYADAFQDEKYRGNVWQLPTRHGSQRFIAGYTDGSGYSIICASDGMLETFETIREAAIAADHLAESNAEEAREYSERWNEASDCAQDIADAKRDAKIIRKNWRTLKVACAECGLPELELMAQEKRADHAELIAQVIKLRERIAELDMQGEF